MKCQTIIDHEIEFLNVVGQDNSHGGYIALQLLFKIKNTQGVLNNTITLKNLIRTSDAFKDYVFDTFLAQLKPIKEEQMDLDIVDYSCADIYPRSGNKCIVMIRVTINQSFLENPRDYVMKLLRGI